MNTTARPPIASDEAARDDVTLEIGGMTCASCVRTVEAALEGVPGVADASVNLATERARVRLEPGIPLPDLIRAVEAAGYQAREPDASAEGRDRERAARLAELASVRRRLYRNDTFTLVHGQEPRLMKCR